MSMLKKITLSWPNITAFVAAIFLVLATGLPIFIVLSHLLVPIGPVWQHLASTVLSGYVLHSILLVIGVTGCAMAIAIPAAWLVAIYDFPGARWLRWGLLAPTAVPAYIAAYAYTDFLQFAGPLQQALRDATGWRHGDYWFPQIRSLGGAIIVMALVFYPYIYLFARTAFEEQGHRLLIVARTLGHGPFAAFGALPYQQFVQLWQQGPLWLPWKLWPISRQLIFCHSDLYHRHLPHMVQSGPAFGRSAIIGLSGYFCPDFIDN